MIKYLGFEIACELLSANRQEWHLSLTNTPMGDELKWLLKEGGRCIFENCDISLENTPTSHTVSLVQDMYACSDSAMPLLSSACLCKTMVPLYAQSCGCNSKSITSNFITGRGYPRCNQRIGFKGPIQVSSVQHDKLTVSGCTHSGCSRTSKEKPKLDGNLTNWCILITKAQHVQEKDH